MCCYYVNVYKYNLWQLWIELNETWIDYCGEQTKSILSHAVLFICGWEYLFETWFRFTAAIHFSERTVERKSTCFAPQVSVTFLKWKVL